MLKGQITSWGVCILDEGAVTESPGPSGPVTVVQAGEDPFFIELTFDGRDTLDARWVKLMKATNLKKEPLRGRHGARTVPPMTPIGI
eukprot:Skav201738  [mRNA]  locus=scaffold2498:125333:128038:+ [translate_table: standard]